MADPVTNDAESEARYKAAWAISSGCAIRLSACKWATLVVGVLHKGLGKRVVAHVPSDADCPATGRTDLGHHLVK